MFGTSNKWAIFIGMMLALGLGELSIREIPGYMARKKSGPILGYLLTLAVTVSITGVIADGLDAFVLQRGRLKNAVSVGLYAGPKSANQQLERVRALGYNVAQTQRKRMRRVHHVSAWVADDGQRYPGEAAAADTSLCSVPATDIAAVTTSSA